MKPSSIATLLLITGCLASARLAFSQDKRVAEGDVAMSYPILNATQLSPIRVEEIDVAAGKAKLTFDPNLGVLVIIPRGETLLLAQDADSKRITRAIRANVTEMLEKGEAIVTFGPEAANVIRSGPVLLVYPFEGLAEIGSKPVFPVSSRKFRQLPEVIPMAAGNAGDGRNAIAAVREATYFAQSVINMKQIMLALHNFESVYGFFPPAVIYGPDGKPWHSWRTLILPFLGENKLYGRYDFSQPWDSPKNKAVVETVVPVYQEPVYGKSGLPVTHYAAIVGEKAAFRPDGAKITDTARPMDINMELGARSLAEITDGTSNTIMLAPVSPDRKIPWAKPEDIVFNADFPDLGAPEGIAMPYGKVEEKNRRAPVARADGSVFALPQETPKDTVRAIITIAGGEIIDQRGLSSMPNQNPAPKFPLFKIVRKPDGSVTGSFD
ncbi:DUF1559 domain-containing protein [bacterium]|nr:DUF1559 domain-containing protein [bacterium]